jgi:hypothetical protein
MVAKFAPWRGNIAECEQIANRGQSLFKQRGVPGIIAAPFPRGSLFLVAVQVGALFNSAEISFSFDLSGRG